VFRNLTYVATAGCRAKILKMREDDVWEPRVNWWNLIKENAMKLAEKITEEGAWR